MPFLETVVVENVGVARRDNDAEAVNPSRPKGVVRAGAAAKVRARKQNRCAFVAWEI